MKRVLLSTLAVLALSACSAGQTSFLERDQMRADTNQLTTVAVANNGVHYWEPVTKQDFVVYFDFDTQALTADSIRSVDRWARWMKVNPDARITLEGHTDFAGTERYNKGLGMRRAQTVKKSLVALGIEDHRVSTVSYGEDRIATHSWTRTGDSYNRRVVITVDGMHPPLRMVNQ